MSCLLAYVLVLQAFLIALSGAQLGLAGTTGDGSLAIELCLHETGDAPALPDRHADKDHCALCVACGHHVFAPPAPMAPWPVVAGAHLVLWPGREQPVATTGAHLDHRPRGPPVAA
ncbi:MAG: DUF2946 family protein [Xanthobacteraceae bacterium]